MYKKIRRVDLVLVLVFKEAAGFVLVVRGRLVAHDLFHIHRHDHKKQTQKGYRV